jgi:hypothetical protein
MNMDEHMPLQLHGLIILQSLYTLPIQKNLKCINLDQIDILTQYYCGGSSSFPKTSK